MFSKKSIKLKSKIKDILPKIVLRYALNPDRWDKAPTASKSEISGKSYKQFTTLEEYWL